MAPLREDLGRKDRGLLTPHRLLQPCPNAVPPPGALSWCCCGERAAALNPPEPSTRQVDQLVFRHLVDTGFPRLAAHLDALGAHVAGVATQWFLCLFVNSLPLETCLRVWDAFFFERCASVLFRIGLALVDIHAQVRPPSSPPWSLHLTGQSRRVEPGCVMQHNDAPNNPAAGGGDNVRRDRWQWADCGPQQSGA